MKILLTSSSFHGGGITSYALEIINNYSTEHEVILMIGETNGFLDEKKISNLIHANMDDLSDENAKRVIKLINDLNPDVLIVSLARVVGLVIPYLNDSIRVISISHSLRYDEADIAAFQAPYIDKIVALSYYNKTYLQKKFKIQDYSKIHVVYNFIMPPTDRISITQKENCTHEPMIVFAGGGAPSKNPELIYSVLLMLLKTSAKFRFYWLGNTNPPLKKLQTLRKIEQLVPNDSRVVFTGRIQRNEATSILRHANIILIPSKREGCPIALLEAMSAGVIALTSDYKNGCREIIESAHCGKIIPHRKKNEYLTTILNIVNNPSNYNHCYKASKKYFEEELSFATWKVKMNELIHDANSSHISRKHFSSTEYKKIRSRWKFYSHLNAIHMLFFETLPSALYFFCRNLYCRHHKHEPNTNS